MKLTYALAAIAIAFILGAAKPVRTEIKTVPDTAAAHELKAKDEEIFAIYQKGLNLTADALDCIATGDAKCINDFVAEIEGYTEVLKIRFNERKAITDQL